MKMLIRIKIGVVEKIGDMTTGKIVTYAGNLSRLGSERGWVHMRTDGLSTVGPCPEWSLLREITSSEPKKEQMTFPKAWAKCKGMGGYIPCPRDNWANNQLNEFIKKHYTTIVSQPIPGNEIQSYNPAPFLETQSKNVVDIDRNPSFWILLSEMGHSPENELMDFYGLFLYFAHAIFQEKNGTETVDTQKLKSIKMIWLGVKKTNGKWLCKDPAQNLNGYEGIVLHYC